MSRSFAASSEAGDGALYATLNVSRGASQSEIHERYRALSLLFHPDKQLNPDLKDVSTRKFLEIQKAYQVLSDPFLRAVYDELGEKGLSNQWSDEARSRPPEEIPAMLRETRAEMAQKKVDSLVKRRSKAACAIDATSLFATGEEQEDRGWVGELGYRLRSVGVISRTFSYNIEKPLSHQTSIGTGVRSQLLGGRHQLNFVGTIRHSFSPRLEFSLKANPLHPFVTKLDLTYKNQESSTTIRVKSHIIPGLLHVHTPSFKISVIQRLYARGLSHGKLDVKMSPDPQLGVHLFLPSPFSFSEAAQYFEDGSAEDSFLPSVSGFAFGTTHRSFGIVFSHGLPSLVGQIGVDFRELKSRISAGIECGLRGLSYAFSASWSNDTTSVTAETKLSPAAIVLSYELEYLDQKFSLPIVLATEHGSLMSFFAVVVPSSAIVLAYQFIIKPRRRAHRNALLKAARKTMDEDSDARREKNAVEMLLKDTAKHHMKTEASRDGLVILEAEYATVDADIEGQLTVDVTIPIQALVRQSQLYIGGGKSKASIQGFLDPEPSMPKVLRIRYLFRGHTHFAEIPDFLPVVLPLEEHKVDGSP